MNKKWKWTDHIGVQMAERGIERKQIEKALSEPDEVVSGKGERRIYQKMMSERLIRVVTDGDLLITAYLTSKVEKYKGDNHED